MIHSFFKRIYFLIIPLLLTHVVVSYGQQHTFHTSESKDKGYWKFRTDYATRRTLVWFYTKDHALIYKEELAGKYLKPSKSNIRSLNQILERLQDKQMVASQTNPKELLAYGREKSSADIDVKEAGKEVPLVAAVGKVATQLQTVAYASTHLPGIAVFIENPKGEQVFIRLKYETQGPFYRGYIDLHEESTLLSHYSVNLNLNSLKASS
jgi:hypothetical protein